MTKAHNKQEQGELVAFITPLMESQMFDDWCPYKGNPDPRVIWAAAIEAANGLLLGATTQPKQEQRNVRALADSEQLGEPVAIVVARRYDDGSHAGNQLEWRGRNEANDFPEGTAFYTTPPQSEARGFSQQQRTAAEGEDTRRAWVGLTDEEIRKWWASENGLEDCDMCKIDDFVKVVRAIEAAHGIKE